jgi:hypothetical protein
MNVEIDTARLGGFDDAEFEVPGRPVDGDRPCSL